MYTFTSGDFDDFLKNPEQYTFSGNIKRTKQYLYNQLLFYYTADDNDAEWVKLKQRYYHIITHDLKFALTETEIIFHEDEYNYDHEIWENEWVEGDPAEVSDEKAYQDALEDWESKKPDEPDKTQYYKKELRVTTDYETNEGLWYINLWHRMNGASPYKTTIEGVDNGIHDSENDGIVSGDNVKSPANGLTSGGQVLWYILEDGLMNSQDWLKYALETCAVTLERVNYSNPTEVPSGLESLNQTWTSIITTNALDISEQQNDRAIAKAEAEYEQKQREIEAKDKQYDSILKLLDTEHNALQTEIESVKAVITKNTERTLKIYSA